MWNSPHYSTNPSQNQGNNPSKNQGQEHDACKIPLPGFHRSWGSLKHLGIESARLDALKKMYGITVPPPQEPKKPEETNTAEAAPTVKAPEEGKPENKKVADKSSK